MVGEGPPSTPFAGIGTARRGWQPCGRHDEPNENALLIRPDVQSKQVDKDPPGHAEPEQQPHGNPDGSYWVPGWWDASPDQASDESAEQSFAATAGVMHELEETEIQR